MAPPIIHDSYQGLEQLATAVIIIDQHFKIIYLNPSAEVLLELSHAHACHHSIDLFLRTKIFLKRR